MTIKYVFHNSKIDFEKAARKPGKNIYENSNNSEKYLKIRKLVYMPSNRINQPKICRKK